MAVCTDIFLNDIHLLHGNVQHIVSCIFNLDVVFLLAFNRQLLDSYEAADSVVFVNHIIALTHIGERLYFLPFILVFCLAASGFPSCENIVFAYPADLFRWKVYACCKTAPGKGNFALKAYSVRKLLQV